MNKGVVVFLAETGWSQAKIARKFGVSRNRICQIVNQFKKEMGGCEVCESKRDTERELRVCIDGVVFLTCTSCQQKLSSYIVTV